VADLTRITVNLTARALTARDAAAKRTGDNTTDVINRALLLYRLWLDLADESGSVTVLRGDETRERVYLL
jgi:hypothetical protein